MFILIDNCLLNSYNNCKQNIISFVSNCELNRNSTDDTAQQFNSFGFNQIVKNSLYMKINRVFKCGVEHFEGKGLIGLVKLLLCGES